MPFEVVLLEIEQTVVVVVVVEVGVVETVAVAVMRSSE